MLDEIVSAWMMTEVRLAAILSAMARPLVDQRR